MGAAPAIGRGPPMGTDGTAAHPPNPTPRTAATHPDGNIKIFV
jgi:hypothetical protein